MDQRTNLLLPGLVVLGAIVILGSMSLMAAAGRRPLTAYQQQLQAQVQDASGRPKLGRDPATQPQTSLAWAASQAVGNGLRTDTDAPAVKGDTKHHVDPRSVLPTATATGHYINGCLIGYPQAGQQCQVLPEPGSADDLQRLAPPNQPSPAPTPTPAPAAPAMPSMAGMTMPR